MNFIRLLPSIVVPLLFASCTTTLPAFTPNAPFLEAKGDARISAGAVLGGVSKGGNLQFAYAPSNHFYVGAGTSLLSHNISRSTYTDLSMGYYGRKGNVAYEFSLSGGKGSFNFEKDEKDLLTRIHLQAAAGYVSKRFQAGGGIRVARNSYRFIGYEPDPYPGRGVVILEEDYSAVMSIEPFFLMRLGGPRISSQLIVAIPFITSDVLMIDADPTLSLGISFKLGKK